MPDAHAVPLRSEVPRVRSLGPIASVRGRGSLGGGPRGLRGDDAEDGRAQGQPGLVGSFVRERRSAAYRDGGILDERLGYYASLRQSEDEGDASSRGRFARYMAAATRAGAASAWFVPEIQALPETFVSTCLATRPSPSTRSSSAGSCG